MEHHLVVEGIKHIWKILKACKKYGVFMAFKGYDPVSATNHGDSGDLSTEYMISTGSGSTK
jgi:hypothetical protein